MNRPIIYDAANNIVFLSQERDGDRGERERERRDLFISLIEV